MKFSVIPTQRFKKEAKRLIKRYPSVQSELLELEEELIQQPNLGISLGHQVYKIRLAIKSKGKGKSGGGRVITYCLTEDHEVYLLTIFDKSEMDTIDSKTLRILVEQIRGTKR